MTKFELLLLIVGFIALISGTGMFSPRSRRKSPFPATPKDLYAQTGEVPTARVAHAEPLRIAIVEVLSDKGATLCKGSTPTSFRLAAVEKGSFDRIEYTIELRTPQAHRQSVVLSAVPNGWYLCGQFIFGPKVGWLVFDPERSGLYYLEQSKVAAADVDDPDADGDNPNVSFVLLEDVPDALRKQMTRLSVPRQQQAA